MINKDRQNMKKEFIKKGLAVVIIVFLVELNISPLSGGLIKEDVILTDYYENNNFTSADNKDTISINSYIDNKLSSHRLKTAWFKVPSIVKRGDIAFCDKRPWIPRGFGYDDASNFSSEHALLYAGNNRFIEATAIIPWIYKGSNGWDLCMLGVLNTSYLYLNFWATNIIFGTVRKANETQRDNAVKWAETQIGHPFQFGFIPKWPFQKHQWWACPNPNGTTYNPDTGEYFIEKYPDYWYCTELIWAAYKHCNGDSGLDIGAEWEYDIDDDSWHWCSMPGYWLGDYENVYLYTDGDYGNPGTGKPLVESHDVEVGTTSAALYGKLLDDGGERCHCYIYLIGEGNNHCRFFDKTSTDTFSKMIYNLEPGTTYHWYAWAYNSFGEAYGEIKSFTTLELK